MKQIIFLFAALVALHLAIPWIADHKFELFLALLFLLHLHLTNR